MSPPTLHLLLAGDDGPVLPDGIALPDRKQFKGVSRLASGFLGDPGGTPDDLAAQRWGLVLPDTADVPAVLDALRPLLDAREQEQGAQLHEPYLAPTGMDLLDAQDWLDAHYENTIEDERDRPRYLLLVGDLHELTPELQRAASAVAWVGRITGDLDALAAYARKAAEPRPTPFPTMHLFPVLDGTTATRVAWTEWLCPLHESLDDGAIGPVDAHLPPTTEWDAGDLSGRRGVLLTSSHGHETREPELVRRLQGAPRLSRRPSDILTPDDIAAAPFVEGGLWVTLACFGGGMASRSVYAPWMKRLFRGKVPGRLAAALTSLAPDGVPFVSGTVKAALASPTGPLAVIAHVDTAWSFAFSEGGDRAGRPKTLEDMLGVLAKGRRVGVAHRVLVDRCRVWDGVLHRLAEKAARRRNTPEDDLREAKLRLMRADLCSYLLFGDPAAYVRA